MTSEERIHLVSQKVGEDEECTKQAGADGAESSDAETAFEDVPVYITCPYCHEKIVTRTSFKSGKSLTERSVSLDELVLNPEIINQQQLQELVRNSQNVISL